MATTTLEKEVAWLHRFINASVFGPPPEEVARAHQIVEHLTALAASTQRIPSDVEIAKIVGRMFRSFSPTDELADWLRTTTGRSADDH